MIKNLFPKPKPSHGKGDTRRPRDDDKWEEAPFWKNTEHYKKNKWAYEHEQKRLET